MRLIFTDSKGVLLGQAVLPPDGTPVRAGRGEGCQIKLPVLAISREHLQARQDPDGQLYLQDLHSRFGTLQNGVPLSPGEWVPVSAGDQWQVSPEISCRFQDDNLEQLLSSTSFGRKPAQIVPGFMERNELFIQNCFDNLQQDIPGRFRGRIKETEGLILEKVRELSAILDVGQAMSALLDYRRLLEFSMDLAMEVTHAERGFIMLQNEETGELEAVIVRRMGEAGRIEAMQASSSLIRRCFDTGRTMIIGDISEDPNFASQTSVILNRIRSAAVTPLRIQNSPIGVLYLDHCSKINVFTSQVREILEVFAALASVAIHNARLFHHATTDGLTGLSNHKHFKQRLLAEFRRTLRHQQPLSLLMLDIDHFKAINDTYGHPAGDQVLRIIGRVLREHTRLHDLPARYGGEEFAIILPDTSSEEACRVGEKLRILISRTAFNTGGTPLTVTVSAGVAARQLSSAGPDELLRMADQALYLAKSAGRNRVILNPGAVPDEFSSPA